MSSAFLCSVDRKTNVSIPMEFVDDLTRTRVDFGVLDLQVGGAMRLPLALRVPLALRRYYVGCLCQIADANCAIAF